MEKSNTQCLEFLSKRLKDYLKSKALRERYNWPLEKALNKAPNVVKDQGWFSKVASDKTPLFNRSLEMRRHFKGLLLTESDNEDILNWIVRDFGQIKRGSLTGALFSEIDRQFLDPDGTLDFKGIASWSKGLAFKYPETAAIYDARVVYSLNWLLMMSEDSRSSMLFPKPEGRNSILNALDYEMWMLIEREGLVNVQGMLQNDTGKKSTFMRRLRKVCYYQKGKAYKKYCALLRRISEMMFGNDDDHLVKVEMLLFSIADKDIALEVLKYYGEKMGL